MERVKHKNSCKHFFVSIECLELGTRKIQLVNRHFNRMMELIPYCRNFCAKYPQERYDVTCIIYERNWEGVMVRYGIFVCGCTEPDFYTLFEEAYPYVYHIVRSYDGMLLSNQLMDSINHEVFQYGTHLCNKYGLMYELADCVMKECFREAVRELEDENEQKYGDDGDSFVYQCIQEMKRRRRD